MFLQHRGDAARRRRGDGAGIRHHQAALARFDDAARAEADLLDVRRVGDAHEDEVGMLRHLGGTNVGVGAELGEGFEGSGAARPDVQGVATAGDVDGHGAAHEAKADESDVHCFSPLSGCCLGTSASLCCCGNSFAQSRTTLAHDKAIPHHPETRRRIGHFGLTPCRH